VPTLEQRTIRKVSWRLLPLIIVIYFVAYIDRTNVGFAALTMNKDLGLSAYVFGWGAGIFFLGYFLFEVPSNVILEKVGARVWIARIMITWGIVSGAMAFVQGPVSFVVMRFLLGVAEAGFFPGMILYFTYWFPKAYRARVISALFIAVPGSNAVAAVISGAILDMDGILGLAGWQWMFIVEAIPAVLLSFVVLAMMTDRPSLATWLAPEEREWLETRLQDERRRIESAGHLSLARALMDRRVLALSAI
jgi:MFS transporter, ACS family, tartrate transporter